jgi:hypothetical protein
VQLQSQMEIGIATSPKKIYVVIIMLYVIEFNVKHHGMIHVLALKLFWMY